MAGCVPKYRALCPQSSAHCRPRHCLLHSSSTPPAPSSSVPLLVQSTIPLTQTHRGIRQTMRATPRQATETSDSTTRAGPHDLQPFTIVGGGRVGLALRDMGVAGDVVVGRGEPVEASLREGPIIVATRNDDLQAVVDSTPEIRRKDLVFIQNGMLQPWLDSRGLGECTQVLVYFAVAKKGEPPTDGKTDTNPEGLTAACGPHAAAFAARLHAAGLSCKVLTPEEFQKSMLEKLIWICAFMLVGARYGGCTVGEVEAVHGAEVRSLIRELVDAGSNALGLTVNEGVEDRLCAYARSVSHFPTAVKEFAWRNGWFYDLTRNASTDPCPMHTAMLREVGVLKE